MPYLTLNDKLLVLRAKQLIPQVTWAWDENTPIYGIGDNLTKKYNCWCPHNLQYDAIRNRFVFVQCHKDAHSGSTYIGATMHIVYPDDILKKTDITIPSIIGIANLIILPDGTYILYPKTTDAVRYVSTDGGTTWTSEELNEDLHHVFGVYYCDGAFYGGCDSVWGEYHYSADGITWETKALDWTDENGCHTKEHSFCYWDGHVYAFGRRDFYVNDDASQGLVDDYNGCAVVFRLDGSTWTMVDDSSLLAFQSNCSPVAFDAGIAIAHINRVSDPALYYSVYDGHTFSTIQTFDNLNMTGVQQEFTTPSLAFGDGYACIACSIRPTLVPLGAGGCINTMFVGTYKADKTTKEYITYNNHTFNVATTYRDSPQSFTFYPSGAEENIAWIYPNNPVAIQNNNDYDVYFYWNDYPNMYYQLLSNDNCYPVYNGEFVDVTVMKSTSTYIMHDWIFDYDNRHFAVGGKNADYSGVFADLPHQFVVECSLSTASTQPSVDLSDVENGTVIRKISANGGEPSKNSGTGSYLTFNN